MLHHEKSGIPGNDSKNFSSLHIIYETQKEKKVGAIKFFDTFQLFDSLQKQHSRICWKVLERTISVIYLHPTHSNFLQHVSIAEWQDFDILH
jgi:hypothetical protein